MIATGSHLFADPERYAQALNVLERERLSPKEERSFQRLSHLSVTALVLSAAWVLVVLAVPQAQLFVLVPATLCYLLLLPWLFLNWPLIHRLYAVRRRQERLQLTRPLMMIASHQSGAIVRRTGQLALLLVGVLSAFEGVIGLTIWTRDNLPGRVLTICLLAFATTCAFIYLVDRARQQLLALKVLRTAMAGNGTIRDTYYDAIVCLERLQLVIDREQTIRGEASPPMPTIRMTESFREQYRRLDAVTATAVNEVIRELSEARLSAETDGHKARTIHKEFVFRYRRDSQRNEVLLQSLSCDGYDDV